jgi:hypothetical protein
VAMMNARAFRYRCVRGYVSRSPGSAPPGESADWWATPRAIVTLLWDQLAPTAGLQRRSAYPEAESEQALEVLTRHPSPAIKAGLAAYLFPSPVDPPESRRSLAFCRLGERGRSADSDHHEPSSPLGWATFVDRRSDAG